MQHKPSKKNTGKAVDRMARPRGLPVGGLVELCVESTISWSSLRGACHSPQFPEPCSQCEQIIFRVARAGLPVVSNDRTVDQMSGGATARRHQDVLRGDNHFASKKNPLMNPLRCRHGGATAEGRRELTEETRVILESTI